MKYIIAVAGVAAGLAAFYGAQWLAQRISTDNPKA